MVDYSEKVQLIKDTIGSRQKYHKVIANHDFTDSEKDILLQASANAKHSKVDQELINQAYNILLLKSIIDTNKIKSATTNVPFIKYLLIFGFLFVLFYMITPSKFEGVNEETSSIQKPIPPKFGSISGQGFLRTKGGSVRTCAGNDVYLEKSNPNGLLYLSEVLQNKQDHLKSLEKSLATYKDWLQSSERRLKYNEDRLREYSSSKYLQNLVPSVRNTISYDKKEILEDKQRISEQKKKISAAKKVVQEYEAKVENSIKDNILKTMCDAQGNYEFPKVELGKHYIRTIVQWYVGDDKQGGIVSKVINVQEGHNKIMITE